MCLPRTRFSSGVTDKCLGKSTSQLPSFFLAKGLVALTCILLCYFASINDVRYTEEILKSVFASGCQSVTITESRVLEYKLGTKIRAAAILFCCTHQLAEGFTKEAL